MHRCGPGALIVAHTHGPAVGVQRRGKEITNILWREHPRGPRIERGPDPARVRGVGHPRWRMVLFRGHRHGEVTATVIRVCDVGWSLGRRYGRRG